MAESFSYDVFLSHSSKDKEIVRPLADRLKRDGIKVWFDEWAIRPGDSIPAKLEEGLERSRILVFCMSANAFGSEWAQLESGTFRFRDPLNKDRRFLPLRLDEAPIRGSLGQFLYIDWRSPERDKSYAKLFEVCRPLVRPKAAPETSTREPKKLGDNIRLELKSEVWQYAFNHDATHVFTCGDSIAMRLWEFGVDSCVRSYGSQTGHICSFALSDDERHVVSTSTDRTLRLWEASTSRCARVFRGHESAVRTVAWSADGRHVASGADDMSVRVWNVDTGQCLQVLRGHHKAVFTVAWSDDGRHVISGSADRTLRLWDIETGKCLRVFSGHKNDVKCVVWPRQDLVISGSDDQTVRTWNTATGDCRHVLSGHKDTVTSVAWNEEGSHILSASADTTVRIWHAESERCLRIFEGHIGAVQTVVWDADRRRAFSGDSKGCIRIWNLEDFVTTRNMSKAREGGTRPKSTLAQYTNAKVLLVGESGAGKTGLSKRLALNNWQPSDSTVGAWATQWKLPVSSDDGIEREIWLWDFGGQADQRLIHQLYMDETALAVLVFDGQKEDIFETLGQWDRDLVRASSKAFSKLLVAGRVDAGGLRVSRNEIDRFRRERKFIGFLETSAKTNLGCEELKQAILNGIDWNDIPCRATEVLFKRLKEEIIRLKDAGRVLMRFNELRETLQLRLPNEFKRFSDEELRAALTLLAGPGVVWELKFGSWVLLQPERINAYAQAVIRTLQSDEHQRGCLIEERVLKGELSYDSMERLEGDEERFVLLAMHQTLVERGLCLRQPTDRGNLLIFPSYYRREREPQANSPLVSVSYRFVGFLDEIYATLVVRLHHTGPFQQDQLWRYASDFKTILGKRLGFKLNRREAGIGELEVYFDSTVSIEERIIFSKYVHEHLLQHARNVERLRHYICPNCNTPVGNREVAMKRLELWLQNKPVDTNAFAFFKVGKNKKETPTIICASCEKRVPLWDELEQCFASPEIQQRVQDMQTESAIVLNNESKERALVGEVISTVALSGQICREFNVSDKGIDMEIEFNDDSNEATGEKLYLQLKSGDSYLRERKSDGSEVFAIRDERHLRYWMAQKFPVLLVIRNSEGEVRWMEVRDWLKNASDNGKKPVKQIVFSGERFDVMSVRRWRDRVLAETT